MYKLRKPSLRRRLLQHVLWPLAITWLLGSALAIGLSQYFTIQAYDRALLDDAYALSAQVRSDSLSTRAVDAQGRSILSLNLSEAEMQSLLYDRTESVYFAVWRADGSLLAGHAGLQFATSKSLRDALPAGQAEYGLRGDPEWEEGVYLGKEVRIVTIYKSVPAPYRISVAQTTTSRSDMLHRLLLWSALPQLILLALLAWWLRRRVEQDLQPLSELRIAVGGRDVTDLRHVPAALTLEARTSDIEQLSSSVNSLFDRLELGIAAQREFSGNVAHELRTPLASIRLQAEHVLTNQPDQAVGQAMQKLLASIDHASHLIDQLLALAFADEARQSAPLMPLDLVTVAREAALRHLARADSLRVDLGAEGVDGLQPLLVLAHRVLVDAVLDNLIDNAFRYGLADAHPKITISVVQTGSEIRLTVVDNGRGLTQQEASHYKGRWAQASEVRSLVNIGQGVGLGLAIVSRYAELLGATFILQAASPDGASGDGLCAGLVFATKS